MDKNNQCKNENLGIQFKNGKVSYYYTISTDELKIPNLGFEKKEEAEFVISLAKLLKAHGKEIYNIANILPYAFRVLGISNDWTL